MDSEGCQAVKYTPHKGQLMAIRWLVSHPEAGLLMEPGVGKTSSTLAAIVQLQRTQAVRKALIIAPLRVCYQVWSDVGEIGKWDSFRHLKVALLHGPRKEEALTSDADLYVINYDGLDWLAGVKPGSTKSRLDGLLSRGVNCLVLDELSKFKHHGTKRFKLLKKYLPRFSRRWGLTGSPAANGLLDLFGEAYALDLGKALGPFVTRYRYKYFLPCGYQGKEWRPAEGAAERIYEALKPLMLSMLAEDYLDMPELVEQDVWVDLPPDARRFYNSMEQEMVAELNGKVHVAGSAGVVSGKCRQIASGGVYLPGDADRKTQHIHSAKMEALQELIDELQGQPLLVGFEYKHDRARLESIGLKHFIDGSTSPKESGRLYAEWNAGKINVLCVHPAVAGHGLNLQWSSCAHVAWVTVPWDFDLYTQTIARVYRQGTRARTVFVHRILARNTVDVVVSRALRSKGFTQGALMDALKDYSNSKEEHGN